MKEANSNESSTITENSMNSAKSRKLHISKKLLKNPGWRKIYKKLRKQKKMSRKIEKIFSSEKQVRDSETAVDPYIERPMEVQVPTDNIDYWG